MYHASRILTTAIGYFLLSSSSLALALDPPKTLSEGIDRYRNETVEKEKTLRFYEIRGAIETAVIPVSTEEDARRVAAFMVDVLENSGVSVLMWRAADFLAIHPHPDAADALYRALKAPGVSVLVESAAMDALVSLGDPRAFEILRDTVRNRAARNRVCAIGLLGETGDARAKEVLREVLEDGDLESELFEILRTRDDRSETHVRERAARDAEGIRKAARASLRKLRVRLESNMVCRFDLDDPSIAALVERGFAVVPEKGKEMYEFYGAAYPFVTTDVMLRAFMIVAREALNDLEVLLLRPKTAEFSLAMVRTSLAQAESIADDRLARLARKNAAFFAVPAVLLGGEEAVKSLGLGRSEMKPALEEIERIRACGSIEPSPTMGYDEDYTKYVPRGRHETRPDLTAYYQALLFLGRMYFPLESEEATDRALLIVAALESDPALETCWSEIDSILSVLIGPRDDLAYPDYLEAVSPARGKGLAGIASFDLGGLRRALEGKMAPRVNTAYYPWPESMEWKAKSTGLRIFGQRHTRAMEIFQQFMEGGGWPPSGLHVVAELAGSARAREILRERGFREGPDVYTVPADPSDPYGGLSEGFIHAARSLFRPRPEAPSFMKSTEWEEKEINTALGGWAEVRYINALYAKDANYYMCTSAELDRFHGYVEPYPEFYARLDTLAARFAGLFERHGLYERLRAERERSLLEAEAAEEKARKFRDGSPGMGQIHDSRRYYETAAARKAEAVRIDEKTFEDLSALLRRCRLIAEKELRGEAQSIEDGFFLKGIREKLKGLAFNRSNSDLAPESMAFVCDVATEYLHGECLEVGVGRPNAIYVAVPDDGKTFVCRGAVYDYYEFTRPIRSRMTGEEWISRTNFEGEGPPVAPVVPLAPVSAGTPR